MHNELAGLSDTTTNSQVVTLVLPSSPHPASSSFHHGPSVPEVGVMTEEV